MLLVGGFGCLWATVTAQETQVQADLGDKLMED